jgi:hypothetical protein
MIRASELVGTALWARPIPAPLSRGDARDAAAWFDAAASAPESAICGDLSPAARGLSVEQHATRILMHLRDDSDRPV